MFSLFSEKNTRCNSTIFLSQNNINSNMKQRYLYPTHRTHNGLKARKKNYNWPKPSLYGLISENLLLETVTLLYRVES